MVNSLSLIETAIKELEQLQARIGTIQLSLLQILTDDKEEPWDPKVHAALIHLETVQREAGETQVKLLSGLGDKMIVPQAVAVEVLDAPADLAPEVTVATRPASQRANSALPFTDPVTWLGERGIKVKSSRQSDPLDGVADQLALYLGDNFEVLEAFFLTLRRRVNGGLYKWFSVDGLPGTKITTVVSFGFKLLNASFLSEFKYIKPHKCVMIDPVDDERVRAFFNGGWLERYALQAARRAYNHAVAPWDDSQALPNARVTLPDTGDGEFDLLVGLPAGRLAWLECKSGEWHPSVERMNDLNQCWMHLPPTLAALVTLDRISPEEKASASALTSMSVLHISELNQWLETTFALTDTAGTQAENL